MTAQHTTLMVCISYLADIRLEERGEGSSNRLCQEEKHQWS